MKKFINTFLITIITTLVSFAQNAGDQIEMADRLRADGKIWSVIAVILIIFIGLILYLIKLDTKISKLEKKLNS
jgi:uncharacterized membrane protein YidH (DUF202 family)